MSFPTNPANAQTTTVNGITYIYNATNNAWKRQTLNNLTVSGNVTAGYFLGNGALLTGIVSGGSYGNTQVTANLTTGFYGNIIPGANLTYNIGSNTAWWNIMYGVSTQARYADLAENYQADSNYQPGTVLVFGGEKEVTISTRSHDTSVAGVVSTNPAHLMNGALDGQNVVPLALQGRVPCLVQGPVKKGTVVVASNQAGVAESLKIERYQPGCVIGKSLENISDDSIKLIEVVVGRF